VQAEAMAELNILVSKFNLNNINERYKMTNQATKQVIKASVPATKVTTKPSRKPVNVPKDIAKADRAPLGRVTIVGTITKIKRPKMVSDMVIGQAFIREGELCIRVLNVCNNNKPGTCSTTGELWVMSLSGNKIWMSSDMPVELVDIEVAVVNK
jgi:hypothetical protein